MSAGLFSQLLSAGKALGTSPKSFEQNYFDSGYSEFHSSTEEHVFCMKINIKDLSMYYLKQKSRWMQSAQIWKTKQNNNKESCVR